ncbi:MAG TPA: uroporphyrinogen-III synthase, partial [Herpetosiphonaceae bacterium]|nr:uroporphyrinogen-III synthase [Herpetosiphonaceae bacterium]
PLSFILYPLHMNDQPPPNPQPLRGRRIALTRSGGQSGGFAARLSALGAEPLVCSAIRIAPPDDWAPFDRALAGLADFDWLVLTSANSVTSTLGRLAAAGLEPAALAGPKVAAIGAATARALREAGIEPDLIPPSGVAESLLDALGAVAGQRILLPQADIARPVLRDGLAAGGADVCAIVAYKTLPDPQAAELATLLAAGRVDAVTFTSSSTVRYTVEALLGAGSADPAALLNTTAVASIGPITSQTARDLGLRVDLEAAEHTTDGLIAALVEYFQTSKG